MCKSFFDKQKNRIIQKKVSKLPINNLNSENEEFECSRKQLFSKNRLYPKKRSVNKQHLLRLARVTKDKFT